MTSRPSPKLVLRLAAAVPVAVVAAAARVGPSGHACLPAAAAVAAAIRHLAQYDLSYPAWPRLR